jgi:CheY-like chemotaxis protein
MIRVLLVDDEPHLLELAKEYLEKMGDLEIITTDSTGAALKKLETDRYDIVVSDYQMPEMDGIEFLKRLNIKGDGMPFILFTGKGREEVAIEALNLGADFYIQKGGRASVQFGELKNAIVQVVNRAKATKELDRRNRELRMLYEANMVMSSTLDLQSIYSAIHHFIKGMMECDALIVTSYTKEDDLIYCLYAWHEGEPIDVNKLPPIPLAPPGEGIQSEAIRTGRSILLGDFVEKARKASNVKYFIDDEGNVHEDIPEEEPTQSALVVPLKHEDDVIGVIQVFSDKPYSYTEDDLRILESLSVHAASAISNGILYQKVSQEAEGRRRAEQRIEAFLSAMDEWGEAILLADTDGKLLAINSLASKELGLNSDSQLKTLDELFEALQIEPRGEEESNVLTLYMKDGNPLSGVDIVRMKEGYLLLRVGSSLGGSSQTDMS